MQMYFSKRRRAAQSVSILGLQQKKEEREREMWEWTL